MPERKPRAANAKQAMTESKAIEIIEASYKRPRALTAKQIINKKRPTAGDVGRLYVMSLCAIEEATQTGKKNKGLFAGYEFKDILDRMYYPGDGYAQQVNMRLDFLFGRYVGLNNWTLLNHNIAKHYKLMAYTNLTSTKRQLHHSTTTEIFRQHKNDLLCLIETYDREIRETLRDTPGALDKLSSLEDINEIADNIGKYYKVDTLYRPQMTFPERDKNPKEYETLERTIKRGRSLIYYGYRFLLGYNTAIDLITAHIKIPEYQIFKMPISDLHPIADRANELMRAAIDFIDSQAAGGRDVDFKSPEERESLKNKIETIKALYEPIDLSSIKGPNKRNIAEARRMIEDDLRAFHELDGKLTDRLCVIDNPY